MTFGTGHVKEELIVIIAALAAPRRALVDDLDETVELSRGLTGGFAAEDIGLWTYVDKNLVVATLWAALSFVARVLDGLIDRLEEELEQVNAKKDRLRDSTARRRWFRKFRRLRFRYCLHGRL